MANIYQNHVDRRIREMRERMLVFKKIKKKKRYWNRRIKREGNDRGFKS